MTRRQDLAPGTDLGPYRVVDSLGSGGMGDVYRALDTLLERQVALKVLPSAMADDPERLARFEREAKSLAALNHPNIVTIHGVGEVDGVPYLAMELVEGRTLGELTPAKGTSVDEFFDLALPLTDALATAHGQGIVHRDLKPANVMVTPEGRVKVLDFGLAKRQHLFAEPEATDLPTETLEEMTREGTLLGTFPYMSPEQLQGRPVDARSDVFSLGVLLHEVLTGERPFAGDDPASLVSAILRDQPPPVTEIRPDLPSHLGRVLRRCLEKDPGDRFQTMRDVHDELRGLRQELASEAAEKAPGGASAGRSSLMGPRVVRWGLSAAALLVGLLAVAALLLFDRSERTAAEHATATPAAETADSPASGIDGVAVLPLEDASAEPGPEYFADGITDALINDLSTIEALEVISTRSVMRYKESRPPLSEIARELGVGAIVLGRVVRTGDEVALSARLVDPHTDEELWEGTFRRGLRDVPDLQSEVAQAVARAIEVAVTPTEQALLERQRSVDPRALDAYLQGRHAWQRGLYAQSIPHYLRAIEVQPDYALAHAGLADSYLVLAHLARSAGEAMPLARRSALRALELDPELADAHASLADVVFHYDWDWERSEREFRRAIELNPGYATAHWWYAGLLAALDRHDEAVARIRRAQQFDPLHPGIHAFAIRVLAWARRPDEILEEAASFRRRFPDAPPELYAMALAMRGGSTADEMVAELEARAETVAGAYPKIQLAVTLAGTGREETARRLLGELEAISETSYVSPYMIALAYALLGEEGVALDWLEMAFDTRAADLIWIAVEPGFDRLRDEPRFRAIVEAMEFPAES